LARTIDKHSPIPYYFQLREIIEEETGKLGSGEQLPSEAQLCETYGVSRTVVRQALGDLENEGVIVRRKGRGTFVASHKRAERLVQSLTGLYEDVTSRGQRLTSRVLRLEREAAPPHVAKILQLGAATDVIVLERLRFVDDEPWVVTTTYMPDDVAAPLLDFDLSERSLYGVLEDELGVQLDRAYRTVEVTRASRVLAEHLGVDEDAPILLLKSTTFAPDGKPIEYFVAWHRGDRSRFEVYLDRHPAGDAARTPLMVAAPAGEDSVEPLVARDESVRVMTE
jgi:GntR family transcriptional regulator